MAALLAILHPSQGHTAGSFTSTGGDWKSSATWGGLGVPGADDTATIAGGTIIKEFNAQAGLVSVEDTLSLFRDATLSTPSLQIRGFHTATETVSGSVSLGSETAVLNVISLGVGKDGVLDPDDGEASLLIESGTVNAGQALKVGGLSVRPNGYVSVRGGKSALNVTNGNFSIGGGVDVVNGGAVLAENIGIFTGGHLLVDGAKVNSSGVSLQGGSLAIDNAGEFVASGSATVQGGGIAIHNLGSRLELGDDLSLTSAPNPAGLPNPPAGSLAMSQGGNALVHGAQLTIGNGGSLEMIDTGTLLLAVDARLVMGGDLNRARLSVANGAGLFVKSVTAGFDSDLLIDGGALSVSGDIVVGDSRNARGSLLRITHGAAVTSDAGFVGRTRPRAGSGIIARGNGEVNIDGVGSTWTIATSLDIGSSGGRDRNGNVVERGVVSVSDGGLLRARVVNLGAPLDSVPPAGARDSVLAIGGAGNQPLAPGRLEITDGILINRFGTLRFNHFGDNHEFDTGVESAAFRDGVLEHRSGTTRLTGPLARFTGAIEVNGGSLFIDTDAGATTTTVNNGGRLGGRGSVAGGVRINDGGALVAAQDNNPLGMSTLTLTSDAQINVSIAALTPVPLFEISGDLILDGTLNIDAADDLGLGMYRIANFGGALTNRGLAIGQTSSLEPNKFSVFLGAPGQVNVLYTADISGAPRLGNGNGKLRLGGEGWADAQGAPSRLSRGDFVILTGPGRELTLENRDDVDELEFDAIQFTEDGFTLRGAPLLVTGGLMQLRVGDGTQSGAAFTATIDTALIGDGVITLRDRGTLVYAGDGSEFVGSFTVVEGHLALEGTLGGQVQVMQGGTLSGVGATATLQNDGTLAPGNSPGILHVLEDFVQGADGRLVIELGGPPESGLFDQLDIGASAILDGTLEIRLVDGFAPEAGMRFEFLRAALVEGTFASIVMPVGSRFDLEYLSDRVVLTANAAVPLPASGWGMLTGVAMLAFQAARRPRRKPSGEDCRVR
ncbi:MAG: hypothetical protein K2Y51_19060 [Gammaproteobacteria bacterium]|nr:hypothetical protein [Gammaproteobacteria bacterium]